jgi:signal transduction histidine kinase
VIADAIAAVEHKHPVIQVEASAIPIIVMGDRTHLTQVLIHLIDNAIHYSYSEQPITIKLNQSKQQATIQVCDRGCGIPSSQQGRIFEPFYRVDQSRSKTTGGSGLGLAIAKSLVVRMGGQISVWSEPGQGSTFTVTLPLRSPQPKALKKGK